LSFARRAFLGEKLSGAGFYGIGVSCFCRRHPSGDLYEYDMNWGGMKDILGLLVGTNEMSIARDGRDEADPATYLMSVATASKSSA